jgi:hypothetical protein
MKRDSPKRKKAKAVPGTKGRRKLGFLDKILCLEGEWLEDIRRELSVEPLLKLLRLRGEIEYIHRRCGTVAEFEYYLRQKRFFRGCRVVYLAFHGSRGRLNLSANEALTLARVAEAAAGAFRGRLVYFGSCRTLENVDEQLQAFLRATGAVAVAGYTTDVNWVESSAFELMFLYWAAYYKQPAAVLKKLARSYAELSAKVGFKYFYTAKRGATAPVVGSPRWEVAEPECKR